MTKRYAKIDGYPNLIRDLDTNAIINIDSADSNQYDRTRQLNKRKKEELDFIKSDIVLMKESIEEIKTLLGRILNESRRTNP